MKHALLALLLVGCSTSSEAPPPDNDPPTPSTDGIDDDASVPPPIPIDPQTPIPSPIRYVIVLVKENHTFDNYFTGFPGAATTKTAKLSTGKTIERPAAPNGELPKDVCHSNACGQTAYRKGTMAGFDLLNSGTLPFIAYSEKQIPNYWQYARNFVLADHYFSNTLGPSTPGHIVYWTAQSLVLDNAKCGKPGGTGCAGFGCVADNDVTITAADPEACTTKTQKPCFDVPILVDHLPYGFTWADYGGPLALMAKSVSTDPSYKKHFRPQNELVTDLATGHLANLTIAHLWGGEVSEHPPAGPCAGENFTVDIVNAAMKLPQWKQMAIAITWDDWGGFYDHVAQPVHACKNGSIFRQGFRLPLILISPYAKKGFVLSSPAEQASVPKLVEELWGMEMMSKRDPRARDGVAGSLMGAFDFMQSPREPMVLAKRTCP